MDERKSVIEYVEKTVALADVESKGEGVRVRLVTVEPEGIASVLADIIDIGERLRDEEGDGILLFNETVVGELKPVKVPILDNVGGLVTTPVGNVVSVKSGVCVDDGKIVVESLKDLDNVDNGLAVTSGTFEMVPRFESEICAV